MITLSKTLRRSRAVWLAAAVIVGLGAWPFFISHALLVNPTAPPPGGQTAKPLNASAVAQQKLGSLILGSSQVGSPTCDLAVGGNRNVCAQLCLNAAAVIDDTTKCIKSWGDLSGAATESFVTLITSGFDNLNLPNPQPGYGYVRMEGAASVTNPYTFRLGPSSNSLSTLFADGLNIDNYAGNFFGRVAINPSISGASGRLCLNGTGPTDCISSWTDIPAASTADKLTLQTSTTTVTESGSVNLASAFNAGSITLGDPIDIPLNLKCGDGLCSAGGSAPETANNCAIDCAAVNPLTSFTATATPGIDNQVSLTFRTASQSPAGSVNVLVVRSDNPNFTFAPADGLTYAVGGMSSFAVVHAETHGQNTLSSFFDTGYGLIANTTYTYRAYQGNPYPRYSTALSASATPTGTVVGDGGGDDEEPIIPPR